MKMKYRCFDFIASSVLFFSIVSYQCVAYGALEWKCSDDAYALSVREDGAWTRIECMRDEGKLCEGGACVDPWRYGDPKWAQADDEQFSTTETLVEKASAFEETMRRLHVHPGLKWMMGARLPCEEVGPGEGESQPREDCSISDVPIADATYEDVARWRSGENDGLWNALYLAAEAFRYAATGDDEALSMIKTLLEGEVVRMRVTGVPGIFTRQYIPPGYPGLSCPESKDAYVPDVEKDDNKWVKVGADGCVWYVDAKTREWTASEHCGLEEFADWCWLDNVSKDEYSGHIFALAALYKLVDDPEVQSITKDLLFQVGKHLYKNKLAFTDWDGRVTEHGRIFAGTFGDYPGFNAAMALAFVKVAAEASGSKKLKEWYGDCMLLENGRKRCFKKSMDSARPYYEYLPFAGLYPGKDGCKANFNNISMHMLSMQNLLWFERDPKYLEIYQKSFDEDVFRAEGQPRAVQNQNNAWFDFIWAAHKKLGPNSDGPAYAAVENGIRMLKQYPLERHPLDLECPPEKCRPYCDDRFKRPSLGFAREIHERCPTLFVWWRDPYSMRGCTKNTTVLYPSADYLLAYWMGRYYGFISEDS